MKLKKLIPLAGITGIAATAAPFVTSCATKGTEIVWKEGEEIVITPAAPKTYKLSKEGLDKLNDDYFEAIDKDHALLTREILWTNTQHLGEMSSALDITEGSARVDKVDKKTKRVTYYSSLKGTISPATSMTKDGQAGRLTRSDAGMEAEIVNVPFAPVPIYNTDHYDVVFAPKVYRDIYLAMHTNSSGDIVLEEICSELSNDTSWYLDARMNGAGALLYNNVFNKSGGTVNPLVYGDIHLHLDHTNIIDFVRTAFGASQTSNTAVYAMFETMGMLVFSQYMKNAQFEE